MCFTSDDIPGNYRLVLTAFCWIYITFLHDIKTVTLFLAPCLKIRPEFMLSYKVLE